MTNPRKTRSLRFLGRVDLRDLQRRVGALPHEVWARENEQKPNRFEALDKTEHIVFRFVSSLDDWKESYERPLWIEWKEFLEPVMQAAVAPYGYARGSFPRIMLAKMAPGGVIHPHVDGARSARWPHKIHVPIFTSDKVGFYIEPHWHHFAEGHVYEVNNMGIHAVRNDGTTDRIHLIFEYYDLDQPLHEITDPAVSNSI